MANATRSMVLFAVAVKKNGEKILNYSVRKKRREKMMELLSLWL